MSYGYPREQYDTYEYDKIKQLEAQLAQCEREKLAAIQVYEDFKHGFEEARRQIDTLEKQLAQAVKDGETRLSRFEHANELFKELEQERDRLLRIIAAQDETVLSQERDAAIERADRLAAEVARLKQVIGLDCGDNSCLYASKKGGVRTNGGCRCNPADLATLRADLKHACDIITVAYELDTVTDEDVAWAQLVCLRQEEGR